MNRKISVSLSLLSLFLSLTLYGSSSRSEYTPLDDSKCQLITSSARDPQAKIDYFAKKCPAIEGYEVMHEGYDARSWIVISKGKKDLFNYTHFWDRYSPGSFPYVTGKSLEWRFNGSHLIGVIFRVEGTDVNPPYQAKSRLIVVRLTSDKGCVIGMSASNEEARKIVDSNKGCQ